MKSMPNKARNTQSPAHLDSILVGCVIDGSHQHPDDFSVAIIRYAEQFGYQIDDKDLVHVLIREQEMQDQFFGDNGHLMGEHCAHLNEVSEQAVNWLNEHVADDTHAFHVEESDLFLSPAADLEAESTDDGPWVYTKSAP